MCLLIPYFGKLPPYLNCFLKSCEHNPDIDWLIFTDDTPPARRPPNVRFRKATLAELRQLFSAKLGFEVNLTTPASLCNFRPGFGLFFAAELKGYDFWGHCDTDMIFGELRKFLSEDILARHDKILCRGHLTLYRNTETVNRYFMLDCPGIETYQEKFTNPDPAKLQFDEWRGINLILRYHDLPQFHDEFIVDIKPPSRWKITRFESAAGRNYPEQVFYWHRGRVFQAHYNCDRGIADDEYAYIHFQKRSLPAPAFDPFSTPGFFITPEGFFPYNREPLKAAAFARYNRERWRTSGEIMRGLRSGEITRDLRREIGRRLGLSDGW